MSAVSGAEAIRELKSPRKEVEAMASVLFSPITLRGLTLPNRVVVSPMCQYNSDNGSANDWHLMHLGNFSLGCAGLVMTEMTDVNPQGRISPRCAGMWSDDNEKALKRVHDFCRQYGVAKLGVQLAHAGRKGPTTVPAAGGKPILEGPDAWTPEAPSAIPYDTGWPVPHAMTKDDIKRCTAEFAAAAVRVNRIGYDLLELHGAHGYLGHQFLSPISNRRTDEYGGSTENRMRFVLEMYEAVRAVWPAEKPIGIRVSATDWVDGGWTPEETVLLAKALKARGLDYMDVSSGGLSPAQKIPLAPGYQVPFSEKVKKEAGIATMTVGLIAGYQQAEDIVAQGRADMIALARGAMWEPRWAWHAAEALGAEAPYAPKMMACQPKLRPQLFPRWAKPAG
jgi:2,4-dienoyl-CoA reductase-like NADH-dependent reductase (Old Yellow Enzyme family)